MRLKRLELSGFKSFAKRTVLDFPFGITAIIGPNGSGKSNIVDSIKWILAEQSIKSLRGKKGEDVIFHGSSSRRSLPMARASLYFAASEGGEPRQGREGAHEQSNLLGLDEVVIARQVDRKGDNSYFLNERKVRLLDLTAYLSRSTIGEGTFRVLSQGMSDKLVGTSPEEFRRFIEDAAGVGEFQDKKHRSILKLRSCRDNLEKVSVLLTEIGPRAKFLKRESNKLDKRYSIEKELKDVARKLFGLKHNNLVVRDKKIAQDKKIFESRLISIEKEAVLLKDDLFSLEGREPKNNFSKELNAKINNLSQKDHLLTGQLIELRGKTKIEKVTISYLVRRLKEILTKGEQPSIEKRIVLVELAGVVKELVQGKKQDVEEGEVEKVSKERDKVRGQLKDFFKKRRDIDTEFAFSRQASEGKEKLWREKEEELQVVRVGINNFKLEEEKLLLRREQFMNDLRSVGILELADVTGVNLGSGVDEAAMEDKMWRLKKKIVEVGAIDPAVAEEYKGVKERYDFLERESKDLCAALESLEGIVGDIDKQIKERYKKTLVKVSEGFNSYFRLMFGGGKASLTTTPDIAAPEGGEPRPDKSGREEGIGINVVLPDKKIKNLNNLSGGERSLISIALLFSLVNIRRPPFLVLDEIDAALDEVNSQRFVRLLRQLAKETQFIIITHNRETMRGADGVYGVSIKDGISHLLSIKLEQTEESLSLTT